MIKTWAGESRSRPPDVTFGKIFLRRFGEELFLLAERPFFRGTGALPFNLMCQMDIVVTLQDGSITV